MEKLFLWIDESGDPNVEATSGESGQFSVGMLVRKKPITQEIIGRALNRLRQDEDSSENQQDQKTLARRYFHASEDSKNAYGEVISLH